MADATITMQLRGDNSEALGAVQQLRSELMSLMGIRIEVPTADVSASTAAVAELGDAVAAATSEASPNAENAIDELGASAKEAADDVEQLGDGVTTLGTRGGRLPSTNGVSLLRSMAASARAGVASLAGGIAVLAGRGGRFVATTAIAMLRSAAVATRAAIASLGREIGSLAARGAQFAAAKGATMLKAGLVGLLAIATMVTIAVAKFGVEQEQSRLKFQVMLQSVTKGNTLLKQLQQFANVTPFSTSEVIGAGQTLLSFGVAAGNVQEELKKIGDISAGTGKPLGELASIYGKVMAKGKMDTEALNQLSEAGVPIVATLAKKYGVAAGAIFEMAEKGQLGASDLSDAFTMLTADGGQFAGMMDQQGQTVGGLWSTLVGVLETAAGTLGEQLAPLARKVLQYFIGWAEQLQGLVDSGELLDYFGNVAIVAITAFAEIIKQAVKFKNNFVAAMKTLSDIVMMIWSGIKTVILGAITAVVSNIETMLNGVLMVYNSVAGLVGKKGVDVNFNWTKALAQQTKEEAGKTSGYATTGFDGTYFGQAIIDNDAAAKEIEALSASIESKIRKGAGELKEKFADKTKTTDEALAKGKIEDSKKSASGPKVKAEKLDADSLTKIGLYNFAAVAPSNLDVKRNQLLQQIAEKVGVVPAAKTVLA